MSHLHQNVTPSSQNKAEETFASVFPKEIILISANNLQHCDAERDLEFLAASE